jgi:hypothetical protein
MPPVTRLPEHQDPSQRAEENSDAVMARGSKHGERRGGRQRGTPNRRSILADRILVAAVAHADASARQLRRILVADRALPGDTRMAIARDLVSKRVARPLPQAGSPIGQSRASQAAAGNQRVKRSGEVHRARLELLWSIARDPTAAERTRRKAAYQATEILLPKVPSRSRWPQPFLPDQFGFAIPPDIAREYRDARRILRLAQLTAGEKKKLANRMALIRARYSPCPSLYCQEQIERDADWLGEIALKRSDGIALTPREDGEEAHRRTRFDCFLHGPEAAARRRCGELSERARTLRLQSQDLSLREQAELRLLQLLHPKPLPHTQPPDEFKYHPFKTQVPDENGMFFPPLRLQWIYPEPPKLPPPDGATLSPDGPKLLEGPPSPPSSG